MCLNIDYEAGKDGSFDGVPPVGMSFEKYGNIMKSGADSGSSEQKTVYFTR